MKKRKRDKYTSVYLDRHGRERCVFRCKGMTHQLPHPEHPDYQAAYEAAKAGIKPIPVIDRHKPRSIGDLLSRFFRSPAFLNGGDERQARVRGILEPFRARYKDVAVSDFTFEHIERILVARSKKRVVRKRTVGGRVASKNLEKQLRRIFRLAMKLKWITTNPAELADGVKQVKGGFHTWNEEEIAAYRARWPLGTEARLYAEIILWTWQRRGDAHRFGPKHLKNGRIQYEQAKGGKVLWLPAAPQLLAAIEAMAVVGTDTFVLNAYGKPFTKDGIGNKMREWCDAAGLPQCSAHGLRKAAARRSAERGSTNRQLKAAGGWSNDSEVSTYTEDADQALLAYDAIMRVSEWELSNPGN